MRAASIAFTLSGLIVAGAFVACATGDASLGDDTGTTVDTDSGAGTTPVDDVDSGNGGFVGPKDGGNVGKRDGSVDGGGTDSGSGGGTDSGGGGGMNDDCVGTQGMQLNKSYSSECTNLSLNYGVCTSGNGDCTQAAIDNMTPGPLCCFTPKSLTSCDLFFGPSCVPK